MKNRKGFLMIVLVLGFAGYIGYNYLYKEHRNISEETSSLEISASYLLERFKKNDAASLLNKTITVTGTVSEIEKNTITLSNSVNCNFETDLKNISLSTPVIIKGRCIGYDDLFEVVKMDQCSIIK
ncbi:OB-fold protein [Ulvibacter litoralis]|uniref:tRNA_anti-like n=1 Tax=Ulvibacter litoralis TaxID=227084 RepID=A0A1G7F3A5_9FLAO|nr:hypothetical protein [Ulvibacter litoralis]GHC52822.1 hypothetical protein GCM10008083_15950 [Ulvibacter litoralis]SDE70428.1 tRNA_anti-like [Ulvibacter litoralis]